MPAALDRLQFAPPAPPGMLRALGFALVAHLLLMLALGWGVNWKRDPLTLSAEAELWSALPQQAAPRLVEPTPPPPAPVPVPAPPSVEVAPPVPEPVPQADIALEREKEKKAQERRKQLALDREKKREAQKQKQLQARRELEERRKLDLAKANAAEDKQKLEKSKKLKQAEEAKRMEAQRQANLDRMKGMAQATGAPTATGTAQRSSGMSDSYPGRIRARVKPNIVFRDELAGNPQADIEVRTSPDGTIIGQRIVKSSGVRSWDEAVLKAVIKTEVLPRDVDGRVPSPLIIEFRPKD